MLEVARRHLLGYLRSPVALVVAAAFLILEGVSFAALVSSLADPARPAPLGAVLEGHVVGGFVHWGLQLAVLAALAARLADERRAGTWEALVTAPVSESAAVVGAWLAGALLYAALWLSTLVYLIVIVRQAPVGATIDPLTPCARSARKMLDGSVTVTSPASLISNTPVSSVEPKRCFVARNMRIA